MTINSQTLSLQIPETQNFKKPRIESQNTKAYTGKVQSFCAKQVGFQDTKH